MVSFANHLFSSLILIFSLLACPFVGSLDFKFSSFEPNDTNMIYQGDAQPNGAIDFNRVDYQGRVGQARYAKTVPLWDANTLQLTNFSTNFSFMINTHNVSNFGHGFVFFLGPVGTQIPLNSNGGFLGLFNQTNSVSSSYPLVLVEFDTYQNTPWDPLDVDSHVGINNNSLSPSVYTSWNASLHSQDIADAWITYDAATKNFSVSWHYRLTSDPREKTSLHYIIDLRKVLPPWVTVGFSASTGMYVEAHTLISWEFSSSLDIKAMDNNFTKIWLISGVSVAGIALGSVIVASIYTQRLKQRKRKAAEAMNLILIHEDLERGAGPRRFKYEDLALATNYFTHERKLGEGGFGAVYKGYLNDLAMTVAVKKFSRGSKQGKKEFVTEVKIISNLRHRNLVQLIGWCHDQDEFLLVYEFMPNGSLDSHIFSKRNCLAWATRYKISLGIASGLLYLHEEWEQCVVHRDIKPSNIMLDSNFNVKLGDFGMARLMDHELGPKTTGLAGTFGYMAPEYIYTGRASKESDVFSFGVVVLEIVTGRKSADHRKRTDGPEPEMGLVEWVWDLYGKGNVLSAVDERLGQDFDQKQAECLVVVGLWCAHPNSTSRASIKQAIQALNFEAPLPKLCPKIPRLTYYCPASPPLVGSSDPTITFSTPQIGR